MSKKRYSYIYFCPDIICNGTKNIIDTTVARLLSPFLLCFLYFFNEKKSKKKSISYNNRAVFLLWTNRSVLCNNGVDLNWQSLYVTSHKYWPAVSKMHGKCGEDTIFWFFLSLWQNTRVMHCGPHKSKQKQQRQQQQKNCHHMK